MNVLINTLTGITSTSALADPLKALKTC